MVPENNFLSGLSTDEEKELRKIIISAVSFENQVWSSFFYFFSYLYQPNLIFIFIDIGNGYELAF